MTIHFLFFFFFVFKFFFKGVVVNLLTVDGRKPWWSAGAWNCAHLQVGQGEVCQDGQGVDPQVRHVNGQKYCKIGKRHSPPLFFVGCVCVCVCVPFCDFKTSVCLPVDIWCKMFVILCECVFLFCAWFFKIWQKNSEKNCFVAGLFSKHSLRLFLHSVSSVPLSFLFSHSREGRKRLMLGANLLWVCFVWEL